MRQHGTNRGFDRCCDRGGYLRYWQLPAYRVLMVWVYDRTGSLLAAILMHASLTTSTFILGPAWVSGSALLVYDVALAAAWWLVVAAVALVNRGHLTRQPVGVGAAPDEPARAAA